MIEVWEFIKSFWDVIHTLLSLVFLSFFPWFVIGIWKLVKRLDVFVRIEMLAKSAAVNHEAVWTPKGYRDTMADHEKALSRIAEEDREKMDHPPQARNRK